VDAGSARYHVWVRWLLLASSLLVLGCATQPPPAAQSQPEKLLPGDTYAPPSLRALPELGSARSSQLHRALTMAGEAFAKPLPPAPVDRKYEALSEWVANDVARWIDQRRDALEETRFQFNSSDPEPATRVIVSAVIGLLQEDTAYQLSLIPQPRELDNEPEIAAMFHELVQGQVDPFQNAALTEYRQCTQSGDDQGGASLRFAHFCQQRYDRLVRVEAKQADALAVRQ
jgi:hypothetical protein